MEIGITLAEKALKKAVAKGEVTYDRFGLEQLCEKINKELPDGYKQLGKRYLYDTVFLSIEKSKKNNKKNIALNRSCLDSIVYYLDYKNIDQYRLVQSPLIAKEIFPIEGNWYSIVRCNSGLARLLISPIKMSINEDNIPIMELRGPHRHYFGVIHWGGGSISSFLTSKDNIKNIHLVFKIGISKMPNLLIGVFSGISSGGDPIAGKEILIRSEKDFTEMGNYKVQISEKGQQAYPWIPKSIFKYFEDYNQCYFKVGSASTFDLSDI